MINQDTQKIRCEIMHDAQIGGHPYADTHMLT